MPLKAAHLIYLNEAHGAPFSGAENHLFVLLSALRQAGVTVELNVMLAVDGPLITGKLQELEAQGIVVRRFACRTRFNPGCLAGLAAHFAARRDYLVHTHLDPADVYGKTAARLAGCRCVVSTVHNNEMRHLRSFWPYLLGAMEGLTTEHIAVSNTVRRHLIEREHVAPDKITVIPYGVPPPRGGLTRAAARARLGLPAESFVVGYIGRLSEQKNVPILLQAARRLQQSQFVLIGTGDLEAQLEASAADLPNVRFLGYLPEAHALLPAFDALCLPSKWEGLGLVLVEAMWCNVPIVGSAAGAIPEMLGDGDYGLLFDPDDVQSLVTALQAVPQRGAALAQRARADVGTRFGVPAMVERTLAVYRRLTDTRLG